MPRRMDRRGAGSSAGLRGSAPGSAAVLLAIRGSGRPAASCCAAAATSAIREPTPTGARSGTEQRRTAPIVLRDQRPSCPGEGAAGGGGHAGHGDCPADAAARSPPGMAICAWRCRPGGCAAACARPAAAARPSRARSRSTRGMAASIPARSARSGLYEKTRHPRDGARAGAPARSQRPLSCGADPPPRRLRAAAPARARGRAPPGRAVPVDPCRRAARTAPCAACRSIRCRSGPPTARRRRSRCARTRTISSPACDCRGSRRVIGAILLDLARRQTNNHSLVLARAIVERARPRRAAARQAAPRGGFRGADRARHSLGPGRARLPVEPGRGAAAGAARPISADSRKPWRTRSTITSPAPCRRERWSRSAPDDFEVTGGGVFG